MRTRLTAGWVDRRSPALVRAVAVGYRGLLHTRQWLYDRHLLKSRALPCGVVSIGNLTVGGTGKTPAVEHAVLTLAQLGARPAVVSRGYGRRSRGTLVVADGTSVLLGPDEAGDEPILLASRSHGVPVVVGENRYEAARLAVERFGASVVVLDDGFQHRSLVKDVEIVLARARKPWGNGLLVPAGPLREPVRALGRADLIVATAVAEDDGEPVRAAARQHAPEVPVLVADHEPTEYWTADRSIVEPATALAHRRLLAFAGIARPDAFRGTLERLGVRLAELVEFPDHFRYRRQDLDMLSTRADVTGATGLITTEKDWVRLGGRWPAPSRLYVLGVRFALRSGEDVWREVLGRALRPHRGRDIGALT